MCQPLPCLALSPVKILNAHFAAPMHSPASPSLRKDWTFWPTGLECLKSLTVRPVKQSVRSNKGFAPTVGVKILKAVCGLKT